MTERHLWQKKRWQLRLWLRPVILSLGLLVGGYLSYKFGLAPLFEVLTS